MIEELKTRGAPFVVSCALHLGLVAGLILTQHWVSSAVVLRPPVLPVQLVTLDAPEPAPPPVAPPPRPAPVKPPRLIAPPKPKEPPLARREEPAMLPPPAPIASRPAATPPPAPVAPAPAPAAPVAGDGPAPAVDSAAAPAPASPATTILSSADGAAPTSRSEAAAPAPSGPRTAAVAPPAITQYARPQGGYQVRPHYPATARRLGVQGTTLLRVHVLADGHIGDVLVEQSAGHPDLDQAAADAVKRWRFDPARRGKDAVAMWVLLPVEFKLR